MSRLSIYLLGSPQIKCENHSIEVDTRKATALLAYLAITGQSHRRASLINLLWPEYSQSRGRTNLRRTIYTLRKPLKGEWLNIDREQIGLNPDSDIWLDIDHFYQHLAKCRDHGHPVSQGCPDCVADLSSAVELYRGDFMSGFSLRDSINFDEWQFLQTESLRSAFADALQGLVNCHAMQNDFELSISYARRWLALDPLNEATHGRLMQLYAASGQRSAVHRQYESCVKVLQDELDLEPQPSTTALYKTLIKEWQTQTDSIPELESIKINSAEDSQIAAQIPSIFDHNLENSEIEKNVFVAREVELAQLHQHLVEVLDGKGHPVFITGGAGQGKTLLIQEFARIAQDCYPDLLSVRGNCNAHTGRGDPYLPFRQILSLLTGDVDSLWEARSISRDHAQQLWNAFPVVSKTLIEVGPDLIDTIIPAGPLVRRGTAYVTGGMDDPSNWLVQLKEIAARKTATPHDPSFQQIALFEQYTRVITSLAHHYPMLLILDDLQWADLGSISLLFHLGRRLENHRVLILGAFRVEELAFGKDDQRHPLDSVINELQRIYGDITINLDRAEKQQFVDAYLDSEPNHLGKNFRETLYHQTKGHPLFTVEFLRGMQERGDLVQDENGYWCEGETLDWENLPTRIEAVIAERISRMDVRCQEALRVASVEGETFTAEVIAEVLSKNQRETIDLLSNQLKRRHRLIGAQEIQRLGMRRLSRYRFRHILFQSYLYHSLDSVERAYLHEVVGTTLENLYQEDINEIAPELARHYQEAGIPEKAIENLIRAGEKSKRSSAHEAAIVHYTQGLALLEKVPEGTDRDHKELEICLNLGVSLILTKGHCSPEVEKTYSRAVALCQQIGQNSEYFQALLGLRRYYLHRGALAKALELGEQLITLAEQMQDPLYLSRAFMMHIETLYRLGEFSKIHEHYLQGLTYYNAAPGLSHVLLFGNDTGIGCRIFETMALWHLGYLEQALDSANEMLAIARELAHPFTLVFGLHFAANLYLLCRDLQSAESCVHELLTIAEKQGFAMYAAWGVFLQGWMEAEKGDFKAGIQKMGQGLTDWQNMGARLLLPNFMINLADAYRKTGQIEKGLSILKEAQTIIQATGERTYEAELYRIMGELLSSSETKQAEAESCFRQALQAAQSQSAKAWELRAAISLFRFQEQRDQPDKARMTLQKTYNSFSEGFNTPDLITARMLLADKK